MSNFAVPDPLAGGAIFSLGNDFSKLRRRCRSRRCRACVRLLRPAPPRRQRRCPIHEGQRGVRRPRRRVADAQGDDAKPAAAHHAAAAAADAAAAGGAAPAPAAAPPAPAPAPAAAPAPAPAAAAEHRRGRPKPPRGVVPQARRARRQRRRGRWASRAAATARARRQGRRGTRRRSSSASARAVRTASGSTYILSGRINMAACAANGLPPPLVGAFADGFPHNWDFLLQHHRNAQSAAPPPPPRRRPRPHPRPRRRPRPLRGGGA